jgi:hypothetical protein
LAPSFSPILKLFLKSPYPSKPAKSKNRDPFGIAACGTFMIAGLLKHTQHTIRFAATRKEVAVTKREAKSAGLHAPCIVVRIFPGSQES